jgi:hypothetical protein
MFSAIIIMPDSTLNKPEVIISPFEGREMLNRNRRWDEVRKYSYSDLIHLFFFTQTT